MPLGLTFSDEELGDEINCIHLAGFDGDRLMAILLLKPIDAATVKMRQVAVHPDLQRQGVGAKLVSSAEGVAMKRGFQTVFAHARQTALEFYEKLGYDPIGEPFVEATIPHRKVTKSLASRIQEFSP